MGTVSRITKTKPFTSTNNPRNGLLQLCEDGNHLLLEVREKVVEVVIIEHLDTPSTLLLDAVSGGFGW